MFPCMIARSSNPEVISGGINGTRNGALQLVSFIVHLNSTLEFSSTLHLQCG